MRICLNIKVATRDNFDINNCKLQLKEIFKKKDMKKQVENGKDKEVRILKGKS